MAKLSPSQIEYLNERINYDIETGKCFWNANNRRELVGKEVGSVSATGYRLTNLRINGKTHNFYLHIYIYQRFNGEIPKGLQIDHIDRNKLNNRLDNLRAVTMSVNYANKSGYGKVKVKGVVLTPEKRYAVKIRDKDKSLYFGTHKSLEKAKAVADKVFFEIRGRFPE